MISLPDHKRAEIERQFGGIGKRWVAGFPDLLDACKQRWQLDLLDIAPAGLPINVVVFATGESGQPLVLKLGCPHPEQLTEMKALAHYDGRLTPKVIGVSQELTAILMERIVPGLTYRASPPDTPLPLNLFSDLPSRAPNVTDLPSYEDWVTRAFEAFRRQPATDSRLAAHVDRAETWFFDLIAGRDTDFLLHGDLHHENILLDAERGWLAIDPKGVMGPRVLECGRFIHNFLDHGAGISDDHDLTASNREPRQQSDDNDLLDMVAVMRARCCAVAAAMDEPFDDVMRAAYVDLVMCNVWVCNDGGDAVMDKIEAARRLNA